jgi:hypothetical protein
MRKPTLKKWMDAAPAEHPMMGKIEKELEAANPYIFKPNVEGYNGVGDLKCILLWYVQGVDGEYFTSRLAALERAARAFPLEDFPQWENRVLSRSFWMEV